MAVAIPLIMVAGAALSAYGAIQQAQAQKAAANYNAELNERNATVALQQAEFEADRVRRASTKMQGAITAGYGAAGVFGGSALDVLADSAAQAQLDIETVKYKGHLQALGYRSSAELDRFSGEVAEQQGQMRAASEFITGIGKAGATYSAGARRIPSSNTYLY